jgi:hypothetical protein
MRESFRPQGGIDFIKMGRGYPGFILPQGRIGRQPLAIEVGEGENIAVRQDETANSHPGQQHGQRSPQPPQPRHQNAAVKEPQLFRSRETGGVPFIALRKDSCLQSPGDGLPQG